METLHARLEAAYNALRSQGRVHTQKDFAALLGYTRTTISLALSGNRSYLTENLVLKAEGMAAQGQTKESPALVAAYLAFECCHSVIDTKKGGALLPALKGKYFRAFNQCRIVPPVRG